MCCPSQMTRLIVVVAILLNMAVMGPVLAHAVRKYGVHLNPVYNHTKLIFQHLSHVKSDACSYSSSRYLVINSHSIRLLLKQQHAHEEHVVTSFHPRYHMGGLIF